MAKAEFHNPSNQEVEFKRIDLPRERDYEDAADANLDKKLVEAIEAARKAGDEQLAGELEFQLGSHFYGSELGL